MSPKAQLKPWHVAKGVKYTTETATRRQLQKPGNPNYRMQDIGTRTRREMVADFEIDIAETAIIGLLLARAQHSKSGTARLLNGLLVCKRKSARQLAAQTEEVPVPDGWELRK